MKTQPGRPLTTFKDHIKIAGQFYLTSVLRRAGGSMTEAARIAGVNRTHFHKLLDAHDIPRRVRPRRRGNAEWRELEKQK